MPTATKPIKYSQYTTSQLTRGPRWFGVVGRRGQNNRTLFFWPLSLNPRGHGRRALFLFYFLFVFKNNLTSNHVFINSSELLTLEKYPFFKGNSMGSKDDNQRNQMPVKKLIFCVKGDKRERTPTTLHSNKSELFFRLNLIQIIIFFCRVFPILKHKVNLKETGRNMCKDLVAKASKRII